MQRYVRILIVLACLSLPLVATVPAAANSYPGLVERQWVHGNDVLNARIAIEVNSATEGRFRLRLRCFRIDPIAGQRLQACDFDHTGLTCWYDGLVFGVCEIQTDQTASDYTWVGSYRRLVAGHTYMADAHAFRARFRSSGYQGAEHRICTRQWTAFQSSTSPGIC
ncbi:MAG TPA: hypothetical protein VFC13_27550 [Actinomycetes bacterium]|nr:hypothetical protein [Actinomycetes bacterium]